MEADQKIINDLRDNAMLRMRVKTMIQRVGNFMESQMFTKKGEPKKFKVFHLITKRTHRRFVRDLFADIIAILKVYKRLKKEQPDGS